jgi:phosphonopyruvate decarboxylase
LAPLESQQLLDRFARAGWCDWIGVPDSTLAPLLACLLADNRFRNLTATNECEAISLALGAYLASGNPAVVYLQNSGFGKTIHPITSLLCEEICRVPVVLLIGWRGAPDGPHDEPQHAKMGRIMPRLLETLGVPYEVLTSEPDALTSAIDRAARHVESAGTPFALVVRPGLLAPAKPPKSAPPVFSRQQAIATVLTSLPRDTAYVATTGKTARELYFLRESRAEAHDTDFYTIGGMGCASSIGLAVALGTQKDRPSMTICVLDGDGAALMQLGSLATIGQARPANLLHIVLDNGCHESTGGQPTISPGIDLVAVARACGYPWAQEVADLAGLYTAVDAAVRCAGPRFLRVRIQPGSDPKLGRPTQTPQQNAEAFRKRLGH